MWSILVGKFFLGDDKRQWQGVIEGEAAPGLFLVRTFSWITGGNSDQRLIDVKDMLDWVFFDDDEAMRNGYEHGRFHRWERVRIIKEEEAATAAAEAQAALDALPDADIVSLVPKPEEPEKKAPKERIYCMNPSLSGIYRYYQTSRPEYVDKDGVLDLPAATGYTDGGPIHIVASVNDNGTVTPLCNSTRRWKVAGVQTGERGSLLFAYRHPWFRLCVNCTEAEIPPTERYH